MTLAFAAIISIASALCPVYQCDAITSESCNYLEPSNPPIFHILHICPPFTMACNISYQPNVYDNCVKKPLQKYVPGEICNLNEECTSGKCFLGLCLGAFAGEKCNATLDCNIGLYCDSVCRPSKSSGDACTEDYECASHLVCENKACIEVGSISVNSACFNPVACQTFFTYEINPGKYICINGPKLGSASQCDNTGNCGYSINYNNTQINIQESCACGMANSNGMYCNKGMGDYANEIAIFIEYVKVRKPYCHASKKFFCNRIVHDLTFYRAFVAYEKIYREIEYLYSPNCVRDQFQTEYFGALAILNQFNITI